MAKAGEPVFLGGDRSLAATELAFSRAEPESTRPFTGSVADRAAARGVHD